MANPKESDVLVIGAGICGVATAFHLAQHGHKVTVLERGDIAGEASGVNAGGLGGLGWGNNPDLQCVIHSCLVKLHDCFAHFSDLFPCCNDGDAVGEQIRFDNRLVIFIFINEQCLNL